MKFPKSPYEKEGGLVYFPRMLDKICSNMAGELGEEYFLRLGKGFDGFCCRFLGVSYEDVMKRARQGKNDAEIFKWCRANGRDHNEEELLVWNSFMVKLGWRDKDPVIVERLNTYKRKAGLADRDDILTFFDFIDVDGKRKNEHFNV